MLQYKENKDFYDSKKDLPISEWLSFKKSFKSGKQGLVGLMKSKDGKKYVFKISKYINYLVLHEESVLRSLEELSSYCPNFCKYYGVLSASVDALIRKRGNPFTVNSKYPVNKELILYEYIKGEKFSTHIKSGNFSENCIYLTLQHLLLAIELAQRNKFTHYDLHSENIILQTTDHDAVLYILEDGKQLCIPTCGYIPVIIDFGFSYAEKMEDGPLYCTMAHTNIGFNCNKFDALSDPKLLLITVSKELKEYRHTDTSYDFRRLVRKIFKPLKLDWDSGWDDYGEKDSIADKTMQVFDGLYGDSLLFEDYDHYCIDLLQSLIVLPIEKQSYSKCKKAYAVFLDQWIKIENEISNPFYNLHILRCVIDAARSVRSAYLDIESRDSCIVDFSKMVYGSINEVSKFCKPKKLNMETLLCSLLLLGKNIEGLYNKFLNTRNRRKEEAESKLKVKSVMEVYNILDKNIENKYVYTKDTKILVVDSVTKTSYTATMENITEDILEKINNTNSFELGNNIVSSFSKKDISESK